MKIYKQNLTLIAGLCNITDTEFIRMTALRYSGSYKGRKYYGGISVSRALARIKAGEIQDLTPVRRYSGQAIYDEAIWINLLARAGRWVGEVDGWTVARQKDLELIKAGIGGESADDAISAIIESYLPEAKRGEPDAMMLGYTHRKVLPSLFEKDRELLCDPAERVVVAYCGQGGATASRCWEAVGMLPLIEATAETPSAGSAIHSQCSPRPEPRLFKRLLALFNKRRNDYANNGK